MAAGVTWGETSRLGALRGSELREGATERVLPSVVVAGGDNVTLDGGKGLEDELADVSENGGVARRNAVVGEEGEEFSQDVVEVVGGLELARDGDEFGADAIGLEELLLLAGVEEAEGGMILPADHAAAAAIAAGEQAAGRVGCGRCERGSFFTRRGYLIALSRFKFHGSLKGRFGTLRPSTATSGQAEARRARRMKRREVRTSSGATCTRYGITQVTRSQE